MKKALAVLMSLVMMVAFCVPSFANTTAGTNGGSGFDISQIIDAIAGFIDSIGGGSNDPTATGGSSVDINGIIDTILGFIGNIGGGDTTGGDATGGSPIVAPEVSAETATRIVSGLQNIAGYSKADIQAAIDQMYADGQISETSYNNLQAALDAAPETSTNEAPSIDEAQVAEVASKVISMLKSMGVTDEQMQGVVDQLYEREVIPENVYNEITNQINNAENTTAASNEGGIGGFLSGIVDTIKGFFGSNNGGDSNNEGGNSSNSSDFGAKDPTGDTALISVAAVAAVAGVALVLTKKKQK